MIRFVIGLALLQVALASAAGAGDHRHIREGLLEVRECYKLIAPITRMHGLNTPTEQDPNITVPRGNIVCIEGIREIRGEVWYRLLIMRMNTLDRSLHMPARVQGRHLMRYGVMLSY